MHLWRPVYFNFVRSYCVRVKTDIEKKAIQNKEYLVPPKPTKSKIDPNKLPPRTKIDGDTIALLERLSLVDCANKKGIETLEEAIAFADSIQQVDTSGVEPLVTVLEDKVRKNSSNIAKPLLLSTIRKNIFNKSCLMPPAGARGHDNRRQLSRRHPEERRSYRRGILCSPSGQYSPRAPAKSALRRRQAMTFAKIVNLCEKHGFFRRLLQPKLNRDLLKLESTGALLQENLRTEWLNHAVLNKDTSVFISNGDISETFDFAKEMCLERPPFGIAEMVDHKYDSFVKIAGDDKETDILDFKDFFNRTVLLRCWMFVVPGESVPFFHQWQRQRRMWWRKFSASPGRYSLTDIKQDNGTQSVDIVAKFPWGEQLVESLKLNGGPKDISSSQLQIKLEKKTTRAQCIVSEVSLSTMVLNILCDAYDEPQFQNEPRPLLRLHRKLAPYKISFSIASGPKSVTDELKDLALYLCRQLRNNHVSCLFLPSSYKYTLDAQWKQYDQLGVPYNVLLNEKTLRDGILMLRSRETTLKEQVHVSNLLQYVEQLFKNY